MSFVLWWMCCSFCYACSNFFFFFLVGSVNSLGTPKRIFCFFLVSLVDSCCFSKPTRCFEVHFDSFSLSVTLVLWLISQACCLGLGVIARLSLSDEEDRLCYQLWAVCVCEIIWSDYECGRIYLSLLIFFPSFLVWRILNCIIN